MDQTDWEFSVTYKSLPKMIDAGGSTSDSDKLAPDGNSNSRHPSRLNNSSRVVSLHSISSSVIVSFAICRMFSEKSANKGFGEDFIHRIQAEASSLSKPVLSSANYVR